MTAWVFAAGAFVALAWQAEPAVRPGPGVESPPGSLPGAMLPVTRVHRYRMSGAIRPFLFWIGRDRVGAGRITWRRGRHGALGFELLIGSDPELAPRRLNRWGYIAEEACGSSGRLLGIISASDEKSLGAVETRPERGRDGTRFKTIRASVGREVAVAEVAILASKRRLTFRDLDAALGLMSAGQQSSETRTAVRPGGARSGFLTVMSELMHASVESVRDSRRVSKALVGRTFTYMYGDTLHDLRVRRLDREARRRVGRRLYRDLVHGRFETRSRATGERTRFEVVYGTSGLLAEIPVWIRYQPRWWLRADLSLEPVDEPPPTDAGSLQP